MTCVLMLITPPILILGSIFLYIAVATCTYNVYQQYLKNYYKISQLDGDVEEWIIVCSMFWIIALPFFIGWLISCLVNKLV